MTVHISPGGLHLIEQFEGLRLQRYLDSVGVPTIGFGTTAAVVNPVPATCTLAQAEAWLRIAVERACEAPINAVVAQGVKLNQNQFDALCSLAYNVGPGVISDTGTFQLARDLHAGRLGNVAQDFMRYVYAGGHVLQGLVNRRQAERELFNTPWVNPTPPVPPDPHRYLWFDATVRRLGRGRSGSERAVVIEYDRERAHWLRWPGRLRRLRDDMEILAARLAAVMEHDPRHDVANHRGWRLGQLRDRADGRRFV